MIDMGALTLFLYITARTSGFVLFNPLLGRQNIPGTFRAGFILVMSAFTYSVTGGEVPEPVGLPAFAAAVLLELALGFVLGMVVSFSVQHVRHRRAVEYADDAAVFRGQRTSYPAADDAHIQRGGGLRRGLLRP